MMCTYLFIQCTYTCTFMYQGTKCTNCETIFFKNNNPMYKCVIFVKCFIWTMFRGRGFCFLLFFTFLDIFCGVHLHSNVFFDMLCCNTESCGIVCMILRCGRLFQVFHRWNKEVVRVLLEWLLFFLPLHPVL